MGIAYRRPNKSFAKVLTSRVITVPTSPATEVIVTSGAWAMQIFNVGPSTVVWGDSNITASTGGILFYSMSEIFRPVQGDYSMYFLADSVAGAISVQEFE